MRLTTCQIRMAGDDVPPRGTSPPSNVTSGGTSPPAMRPRTACRFGNPKWRLPSRIRTTMIHKCTDLRYITPSNVGALPPPSYAYPRLQQKKGRAPPPIWRSPISETDSETNALHFGARMTKKSGKIWLLQMRGAPPSFAVILGTCSAI